MRKVKVKTKVSGRPLEFIGDFHGWYPYASNIGAEDIHILPRTYGFIEDPRGKVHMLDTDEFVFIGPSDTDSPEVNALRAQLECAEATRIRQTEELMEVICFLGGDCARLQAANENMRFDYDKGWIAADEKRRKEEGE